MYIGSSYQVEKDIKRIYDQATWLYNFRRGNPITSSIRDAVKSTFPSITWFLFHLGPLMVTVLLLIFGPRLFKIPKFVTSSIQFHVNMMTLLRFQPISPLGEQPTASLSQSQIHSLISLRSGCWQVPYKTLTLTCLRREQVTLSQNSLYDLNQPKVDIVITINPWSPRCLTYIMGQ